MGRLDRLKEEIEQRTGMTLRPSAEVAELEESRRSYEAFREEASELAYHTLDYASGRPQEMRAEQRQRLAQKARIALARDPLAGAEAEHYANFALGRGVGKPQTKSKKVQAIIDQAWLDPTNQAALTSSEAQRAISHELRAGANIFPVAYVGNGKVKLSFLDSDSVTDIVTDPDNRLRPLWYVSRKRKVEWDFDLHHTKIPIEDYADPNKNVRYYEHWCHLEEARKERKERKEPALTEPPKELLGEGIVYHMRINRTIEQQFGVPPWARSLRYYTAMGAMVEARVSMSQAASSFIAKRVMKGGQRDIVKAAQSILTQTGEIGSQRFDAPIIPGVKAPPSPASIFAENESHRLESLSLNSGAAQAAQDAQIVRGAAVAASGFGQHYFGDASNSNLASAVALELPALMAIGGWQEVFEGLFKWFTDLVIQEAVRSGKLGGSVPDEDEDTKPLEELCLYESEDREVAEKRTGEKLDYTFEMPYPGRRNLPDVNASFTGLLTAMGGAQNEALVRRALMFLFTHGWQLEDATDAVEEIILEQRKVADQIRKDTLDQMKAQGIDPGGEPPDDEQSQYGEKRQGTVPDEAMGEAWLPDDLAAVAAQLGSEAEEFFDLLITPVS